MCHFLFSFGFFSHKHPVGIVHKRMFSSRRGRKCSPVLRSCHQDSDTGKDFFLPSPYYFPEQTVISSIFHAYGHEWLALPYLSVNKTGISWLQFALEDKEGAKTSSEIWCVSCWPEHASGCRFSFAFSFFCVDVSGRLTPHPPCSTHPSPGPISSGNKEAEILSKAFFFFLSPRPLVLKKIWTLLSFPNLSRSCVWGNK